MARQRFIWPTIWDDPDLGRLSSDARLLYIGCFSLADDEGRIIGDPTYLRTAIFRYRPLTDEQIAELRDEVAGACKSFRVYAKNATEYIALANWDEFQKPKYPKPSKLPPPPGRPKHRTSAGKPLPERSRNGSEPLPEASVNVPLRDGLGLYPPTPQKKTTRRRANRDTTEPPAYDHACPHCPNSFRTQHELDAHIEDLHPADPADDHPL